MDSNAMQEGCQLPLRSSLTLVSGIPWPFCQKPKATQAPPDIINISLVACNSASKAIRDFVNSHHIAVLDVAGPRLSSGPAIYAYAKPVIKNAVKESIDKSQADLW
jgi:hypothetical protein